MADDDDVGFFDLPFQSLNVGAYPRFTDFCAVCSNLAENAFPLRFSLNELNIAAEDCATCVMLLVGITTEK